MCHLWGLLCTLEGPLVTDSSARQLVTRQAWWEGPLVANSARQVVTRQSLCKGTLVASCATQVVTRQAWLNQAPRACFLTWITGSIWCKISGKLQEQRNSHRWPIQPIKSDHKGWPNQTAPPPLMFAFLKGHITWRTMFSVSFMQVESSLNSKLSDSVTAKEGCQTVGCTVSFSVSWLSGIWVSLPPDCLLDRACKGGILHLLFGWGSPTIKLHLLKGRGVSYWVSKCRQFGADDRATMKRCWVAAY